MLAGDQEEKVFNKESIQRSIDSFRELKSLNLKEISYETIKTTISKIVLPVSFCKIRTKAVICRARFNLENKNFVNKDELTYRKDLHNITGFGRTTPPHKSAFYASGRFDTAIYECVRVRRKNHILKNEELITVGFWEIIEDLCLIELVHDEIARKHNQVIKDRYKIFEKQHKHNISKDYPLALEILKFYSDNFSKLAIDYEVDYKMSCAIYEAMMSANRFIHEFQFHGIMYPSAMQLLAGLNFSIEPNIVDTHLKLIEVRTYKIKKDNFFITMACHEGTENISPEGFFKLKSSEERPVVIIDLRAFDPDH